MRVSKRKYGNDKPVLVFAVINDTMKTRTILKEQLRLKLCNQHNEPRPKFTGLVYKKKACIVPGIN